MAPGDEPSVAMLLEHLDTVYAVACFLMPDERSAEEAVQETYRRAARSFADVPVDERREWIVGVARCVCSVAGWRRPSLGRRGPITLREALDGLSAEHREVVVLREVVGLSYESLSRIVGVSIGTIASRLSHARELLRDGIDGEGGEP